ncbi:MAG: 3-deoxy-8-phosphooctulonate synthase [Leptospiraceae bacterium]|nr:3-deoxy-8-phosphooctulonate synthase [Leptospiraceae bacterium]MDW7976402.1 3-deoxy-8-phosphooctulonate synthase [Leptospiraceae bacterium]
MVTQKIKIINTTREREFFDIKIGAHHPFFLIAGPCVIETKDVLARVAEKLKTITEKLGIFYVFKSSFDKANRTSITSKRGPGLEEGLKILQWIKTEFQLPVLTDVHETHQVPIVAEVVDVLQVPAFLSRQTDLIVECAKTQKWVNVKKGQFLAPWDVSSIKEKFYSTGNQKMLITERGVSFGYNNLVFDPRSIPIMQGFDLPVVFDGTHSTQQPGGFGTQSGGNREMIPYLLKAAVSIGIEGIFMEIHPDPQNAWSDSATQFPLDQAEELLKHLYDLDRLVKTQAPQ